MSSGSDDAVLLSEKEGVILDSLPYVDSTFGDYEVYAQNLIEHEMQMMEPPSPPPIPPLRLNTPLLRNEYEMISKNQRREPIEFGAKPQRPSDVDSIPQWLDAVRAARVHYEAERQRSIILEIEKSDVSSQQWKKYSEMVVEPLKKVVDEDAALQKSRVEAINARRQKHQTGEVGRALQRLEGKRNALVQKKFHLEIASANLESEVASLRRKVEMTTKR